MNFWKSLKLKFQLIVEFLGEAADIISEDDTEYDISPIEPLSYYKLARVKTGQLEGFIFMYDYCMTWDRIDVYYKGKHIASGYSGEKGIFAEKHGWFTKDRKVQMKLVKLINKVIS
jgi:hypothetical protein